MGSSSRILYLRPLSPHVPPPQVNQHFVGPFADCPDSDFGAVIQRVDAVLFSMHPLASPIAPTRVWCLFEIATAHLQGTQLQLIALDGKGEEEGDDATASPPVIDVANANATVESDKAMILDLVVSSFGSFEACNSRLLGLVQSSILDNRLLQTLSGLRIMGRRAVYTKHDFRKIDSNTDRLQECAAAHPAPPPEPKQPLSKWEQEQQERLNGLRLKGLALIGRGARIRCATSMGSPSDGGQLLTRKGDCGTRNIWDFLPLLLQD